jgi:purine-nucleoside/S-methyl-5'-thioadenosine phosphorylase / adenosine deaminase
MPRDALNLAGFQDDTAENIYENRRRFLRLFDGEWALAAGWQEHGTKVRVVRDAQAARGAMDERGETEYCDALVTNVPHVMVGVKTADCVPILLGDARRGAVAAIHAGWRGTLSSIVTRALDQMRLEYGTRAETVRAAIGPAARACCYEVGAEVVAAFRARTAYAGEILTPTREGHALIDLQRANYNQLITAGVTAQRIHTAPLCTMCRTDLFFSYRREKGQQGGFGRLMSIIGKQGGRRNDEG